jgi:hypothetical protein
MGLNMENQIKVLTGVEAVRKRPVMYVERAEGFNVVKETIKYAVDAVCRGGEALVKFGDGSRNDPFIVRTFEELQDFDPDQMVTLLCGKAEDEERTYQFGVMTALCSNLQVDYYYGGKGYVYRYSFGERKEDLKNDSDMEPGMRFTASLDLNLVEKVSLEALVEYLSKCSHFHWIIDRDSVLKEIIFRGKQSACLTK